MIQSHSKPPPNLLFVFADQMRGMDMACAGNSHVQTPHLDRFAAQSAYFPLTFANAPVCGPSRAIMLTGRYPLSNRVVANDLPLPDGLPTFGTVASEAGYRTGYIGKWHLDGTPRDKWTPPGPRRCGRVAARMGPRRDSATSAPRGAAPSRPPAPRVLAWRFR